MSNNFTRTLLITAFFTLLFANMFSQKEQETADALLNSYLETGSLEDMDRISELYGGSSYIQFCEAYELLDLDNTKAFLTIIVGFVAIVLISAVLGLIFGGLGALGNAF